ncbi:hypothetical protein GOBAR_AA16259 [Gossypium barbadense]|uniref:Uncharacterized protein n=1 Tax=Gossypium barbadense TaxID=3634 RepID=A0A2P5XM42_GOSBA|nr:hypothetical protein GOBAR_AA16259 [Gossypium barbadense]
MKPPHELAKMGWWLRRWVLMTWREIISNVLWILLLNGLDEAVLRREPEVPSQSSHIGPDRDDPSPKLLRLMADGGGNETPMLSHPPCQSVSQGSVSIPQGWRESRCLGAARIEALVQPPNSGMLNWSARPPRRNWTIPGSSKLVMTRPTPRGQARNILYNSSWGPKGTWRNGCLISVVGPKDDDVPFLFFEVGTTVSYHMRMTLYLP